MGWMFHFNFVCYFGMQGDFDGFWIDVEYLGLMIWDIESVMIVGMVYGFEGFVRVLLMDYVIVIWCFESGVVGVLVVQIYLVDQVDEFVCWVKFVFCGNRGMNLFGYDGGYGLLLLVEFVGYFNE